MFRHVLHLELGHDKTVRSNTVPCAIISDWASIFEFMQHYEDSDAYEVRLFITKVLSLTHAVTSLISWVWDRLRDHDHPQHHEYDHRTQGSSSAVRGTVCMVQSVPCHFSCSVARLRSAVA